MNNAFVVKYDSLGTVLWAVSGKGNSKYSFSDGIAVATDNLNNVYITGDFSDTVVFGKDTLTQYNGWTFYVAKYNQNGNSLWAKQTKDYYATEWIGSSISINSSNDIYVSGFNGITGMSEFYFSVTYGTDSFNVFAHNGSAASFIFKIDTLGNLKCAELAGDWVSLAIAADPFRDAVYSVGNISDTTFLGTDTLFAAYQTSNSSFAKWRGCNNITGINELSTNPDQIKVYPNPSNGVFNLQFSHPELVSGSHITVYNELGSKLYDNVMLNPPAGGQHDYQINLDSESRGIYFYRITSGKGELLGSGKLVVE